MFCGTTGTGSKETRSIINNILLPICLTYSIRYIRGSTSPRHRNGVNFQTIRAVYLILPTCEQIVETEVP